MDNDVNAAAAPLDVEHPAASWSSWTASASNGCVERVQQTILDECWKPAFARYLIPNRPGCGSIWNATSGTRTPNGRTPAAVPAVGP